MIAEKGELIKWLIDQPDGRYEAKPYKEKRSLTANSYYWVLLTDLAGALRTSRPELHEEMLRRYGQYLRDTDGNIVAVLVSADTEISKIGGHYELYDHWHGGNRYKVIRGSRTYDTKEFSRLLDGLVSECKEAGVETLTPAEIARLRGYEKP